jgi:hypothetical protein
MSVMCLSVIKCRNNVYTYKEGSKEVETKEVGKKEGKCFVRWQKVVSKDVLVSRPSLCN